MTKPADLIAYLFEEQTTALSAELLGWMDSSAAFIAFVETYRDKIRKKLRVTRTPKEALDVRGELEVACRLLGDRRFAVVYEPVMAEKRRGPDFAVTYRANLVFNIEVARIRSDGSGAERVVRILLDKLGQMQPGMPNLLVIHTPSELVQSVDLPRLMAEIKTRVESKDPAFYAITHYTKPADFYKDFLRLSAILLWSSSPQLWVNKQARPALDEKVMRVVLTLAAA